MLDSLDAHAKIKFADFGLSELKNTSSFEAGLSTMAETSQLRLGGTAKYCAPEMFVDQSTIAEY